MIRLKNHTIGVGVALVIILGATILVIGSVINRIAVTMNDAFIDELSRNHLHNLQFEIQKSIVTNDFACEMIRTGIVNPDDSERLLMETISRLAPKISRIRIDKLITKSPEIPADSSIGMVTMDVITDDTVLFLSYRQPFCADNQWYMCYTDVSLRQLNEYLAFQPASRSYATLLSPEGMILVHPEESLIGKVVDRDDIVTINEVIRTDQSKKLILQSEYIGLPIVRTYYPAKLGGKSWVIAISVPTLTPNEYLRKMSLYIILIALVAIVFTVLIIVYFQKQWRKEHLGRVRAEKEAAQIQLQVIINQINPHFLFNSLNSLYALINQSSDMARQFVIKLSGVYRYILDQGKHPLASLETEIEVTQKYFFLQKTRFNNQISLTVDVEQSVMKYCLPSVSLQTVVENAIKHNCVTESNPLHIRIYTKDDYLIIENNLTPRNDNEHESHGVGLERIRNIYGYYTKNRVETYVSATVFRCSLPLIKDCV